MKKVLYFSIASLVLLLAGCTDKRDIDIETYGGKGLEFVHFENAGDEWVVSETDESFDYNVNVACTYKHDQNVTYNVTVGDATTGVEGKDFSIPNKSVTIKAGEYIGSIPVKILYDTVGEGFVLELVLNVDDNLVNPIYGASSMIAVATDKITLDWAWLLGKWTAQDESGGDPYTMVISQKDETTAVFTNIWGMGTDMEGTVDFDAKTVAFKGPIDLGELYDGSLMVAHLVEEGKYDDGYFYANLSPLGITITGMGYYLSGGPYDGYDFGGDTTKLTR